MKKHGNYVVECTTDYSKFETTPENRKVRNNEGSKALRECLLKYGFLPVFPIWVYRNGNKLKIKSGHHRYEYAKELGLPIYYIVYPNIGTMYEFEHATNRWIIINFLESLVFSHPEYQKVLDYYMKTKIPISTVIQMLAGKQGLEGGGGPILKNFKKGEFKVTDTKHAEFIGGLVSYLKNLGVKFASNRSFVMALSSATRLEGFDIDIFKKKSKSNIGEYIKRSSKDEYLEVIQTVYNKGNSKKLPIVWNVKNPAA